MERHTPSTNAHETEQHRTPPRIYVASLSDYNNGTLHGAWIDATLDLAQIHEQISAMLATSAVGGAEEFAIHDYEGFYGFDIGEYEDLATVQAIAEGIAQHGEAYGAYVELVGTDHATLGGFEDCYRGTYTSLRQFVDGFVEDMGWETELQNFAARTGMGSFVAIDYDSLEDTFRIEWDVIEGHDGIHIFTQ